MKNNNETMQMNLDISQTAPIESVDGNQVFQEAVVLRKASKFLTGTKEDAVIPISVFIDVKTGKILTDLLPKELREEYEKYNETR